ncbi:MAG: hypothetical protein A2W99_07415 [Bacteroidetes bacterium GWF2_33_16]|nr:MAG: hypothetical protein A2X00_10365 [Bacteroidetes bacterium GWE2_32_14]OFY03036.1 MAG: hypothetical protein A2W99_07415 [Bacteroidetes bacterium GWF2_33_16]
MDRTLKVEPDIINKINYDLNALKDSISDCEIVIWKEIPEKYLESYYQNEKNIHPDNLLTFESWKNNISKNKDIIYSIALKENKVISSILSNNYYDGRMINLWHTSKEYRNNGYGKAVFLNCLIFLLSNHCNNIYAWDVTSKEVDNFLFKYGFR